MPMSMNKGKVEEWGISRTHSFQWRVWREEGQQEADDLSSGRTHLPYKNIKWDYADRKYQRHGLVVICLQ